LSIADLHWSNRKRPFVLLQAVKRTASSGIETEKVGSMTT